MEISNREFENVIQQTGRGDIATLKNYLESGGDPNRRRPKGHREPLLVRAAYYGQLACVKLLLSYNATVSLGEADSKLPDGPPEDYEYTGMNALAWAKAMQHSAVIELLELHSAVPESRSDTPVAGSPMSASRETDSYDSADAAGSPLSASELRAPIDLSSPHSPSPVGSEEDRDMSTSPREMSPALVSEPSEVLRAKYKLNANKALDKEHELKSLTEIVGLPPSALQGLAEKADKKLAMFEPPVETIKDLGDFKYYKLARAIKTLAAEERKGDQNRRFKLNTNAIDPGYNVKSFKEMLKLPVGVLRGIDKELVGVMRTGIAGCGKIKTLKNLADYKYARWAEALSVLSKYQTENFASKAPFRAASPI